MNRNYVMDDVAAMDGINKEKRFTVKAKSKIECLEESKNTSSRTSVCLALIKWISTILIFTITLSCLVASKVAIISIAQRLRPASFSANSTTKGCLPHNNCEAETAFVMIILLIIIPQVIGLLRAIRNSAFSRTELWPSKFAIMMGIISALLETVGLCFFTLVLISTTDNFSRAVLFMNGIFVFPILLQIVSECRKISRPEEPVIVDDNSYVAYENEHLLKRSLEKPHHWRTFFLFLLSALCAIAGFAFIMIRAQTTIDRIIFPVAMLCLSIAWSPKIFKQQIQPSAEHSVEYHENSDSMNNYHVKSARHRMMLISCTIKIIMTFLVAFILNYVFNITTLSNPGDSFVNGFKYFMKNKILVNTFFIQLSASFFGYIFAWLACTMNLQKVCFVLPLLLATPLSLALTVTPTVCQSLVGFDCKHGSESKVWETIVIGVLLWLSQVLSLNFYFFKSQQFLMAREDLLFWLPTYDACLLEQHLLLNRKNEVTDERYINYHEIVKESHIYICTTMYHEADYEMEQLLQSLASVDQARKECGRQFEAHIWLDDGARGEVVKWYALQLLSLVQEIMGIDPAKAFKLETPYGMQLKWLLPHGMPFILHLKDKVKVKAKKRWSQVMYMSYILDFKQVAARDDLTYILATDADVQFSPNDVMALMDFMSRNPKVGAVCGRTHPMGSGPMVWYQIFDYAIGHWLLKVANHVFGSVLCSPGCFSVYRAKAIREVLPLYASGVDCAMDFLMKDMGEDRWFCTLLVESGWKLEYCATAVDSTYCPETFDEFFKQRRRWGPSTLANSIAVLDKHKTIRENNDAISIFFIIYQAILMVSTIIGPSTVLLVVAGGLQYAFPEEVNMVVVLILLVLVTLIFTLVCLYAKQDTQLKVAKLLTFLFAIIMSITIVGIILQTVTDIEKYVDPPTKAPPTTPHHAHNSSFTVSPETTLPPEYIKVPYIFTPATWYLLTITGIFIVTAFLHGLEGIYLIHGIWYLLCLPSGYLLLTIYSVANLTDRSWGTREGKTQSQDVDMPFTEKLSKYLKYFCWCCIPPHLREKSDTEKEKKEEEEEEQHFVKNEENEQDQNSSDDAEDGQLLDFDSNDGGVQETVPKSMSYPIKSVLKKPGASGLKKHSSVEILDKRDYSNFRFPGQEKMVTFAPHQPRLHAATTVQEWLRMNAPHEYQCYVENFKNAGYDNVAFIAGAMKEKDLINIGIENRGHRKRLIILIESLPPEEMFQEVPENVEEWLLKLGLEEYWPKFLANSYTEPRDLADIKYMTRDTITVLFDIKKEAHLKKLLMATSVLQYPTKAQTRIREARKAVMAEPAKQLKTDNADDGEEFEFWEELRQLCLLPEQAAFNQSGELVEKLGDLRDTCLMVLTVANVLWLTFMVTIMEQGQKLAVLGTSFASVAFLFIYGLVLVFQFISLLWHRLETLVHFIARAPFKPGHFKSNWSWRDDDLPPPPDQSVLDDIRRKKRKLSGGSNHSDDSRTGLGEPLLRPRVHTVT